MRKLDPYAVVHEFESAIAEYTGAPFAVAVNSCTMALLLALTWWKQRTRGGSILIPRRTYPSVPMSAIHAGLHVSFSDDDWQIAEPRIYELSPSNVWDAAKRFTSGMWQEGTVMCVSFHPKKPFGLEHGGGAILHSDPEADRWYRKARFDARTEGITTAEDEYTFNGWHCYMFPAQAAAGLYKLSIYPKDHPDDPPADYPDLARKYHVE